MHSRGIVHCDLKPENILVDQNYDLKIADFGLSLDHKISKLKGKRGTKSYASPEFYESGEYDGIKADLFSLGVILFVMVTNKLPFREATIEDQHYNSIATGKYEFFW